MFCYHYFSTLDTASFKTLLGVALWKVTGLQKVGASFYRMLWILSAFSLVFIFTNLTCSLFAAFS